MQGKLEKEIERKLVAMVKRRGGVCLKWVCPGWNGVPDRIVLLPGGHIIFVELKRPKGGKISVLQQWWHSQLKSLGFKTLVVKDEIDINQAEMKICEMLMEKK